MRYDLDRFHLDPTRKVIGYEPKPQHGDILHICWMIHNACNHKCSYCHPNTYGGSHRWLKYDQAIRFLDSVLDNFKHKDNIVFSFTGGEPTLWPDFFKLCEYLKSHGCQVGMTSNGGRRSEFFAKSAKFFDWVSLSYHPEFTDDDHMLGTIRALMKDVPLGLRLMMHKEKKYWDRCMAFAEKVRHLEDVPVIHVEYAPLVEDFASVNPYPAVYEPWQIEQFKTENASFTVVKDAKNPVVGKRHIIGDFQGIYENLDTFGFYPNDIVAQQQNNFKGWSCYVGMDQLFIDAWGTIWGTNCKAGGLIGCLNDDSWKFPQKPIFCSKSYCACNTDILTRKYHPDHSRFSEAEAGPGDHTPWMPQNKLPKFEFESNRGNPSARDAITVEGESQVADATATEAQIVTTQEAAIQEKSVLATLQSDKGEGDGLSPISSGRFNEVRRVGSRIKSIARNFLMNSR